MGKDKLELFEQSTVDWEGDPSDSSLFLLWKKTELELTRLNTKSKQTASNDNTLLKRVRILQDHQMKAMKIPQSQDHHMYCPP